jgi:hypothetical protein
MNKSRQLILMATYSGSGLDADFLAKICNKEDASLLFGVDGEVEYNFKDGSTIMFDGVHVVEYSFGREVWRDSKPENYYNYNLPCEE